MATQLKIKRRIADATAPSGLTLGELAVNTVDNKLYVGNGIGNIIYLDSTAVVTSVNGATGAISNVAVTTTALSQFAATTSAQLRGVINDETGTGALVFGTSPAITTSITTPSTTFSVANTTAITGNLFGAAHTITVGAITGTAAIRNPSLRLGNTSATITTNNGSLSLIPNQGNLILSASSLSLGDNVFPVLTVTALDDALGQVQINSGDLYLGTKNDATPVNIIFEGAAADAHETTLTVADPTADRTITLPNASGTIALLTANTFTGAQSFSGAVTILGGYSEAKGTATQATTVITLNNQLGNVQTLVPSQAFTTLNITNLDATATNSTAITLVLAQGGTGYGITGTFAIQVGGVGKTLKWAGATQPTITTTANKTDILNFITYDGGTTWYGLVVGQNF